MILIADSGSTKADWRLLKPNDEIIQYKTSGFNPFYQSEEEIFSTLNTDLKPHITEDVSIIYYYGTGCAESHKKQIIYDALIRLFPEAEIHIENDMIGAARAMCLHEKGIACILGTGANTCLFDGNEITMNLRSYGFLIGDEGSGGYLGKQLIADYLRGDLPEDLKVKFEKRYGSGSDEIMDNIYGQPLPNRYMASFTRFLHQHRNHPHIYKLIYNAFTAFTRQYICKYPDFKETRIHFCGSVAFYFSDILRQVGNDNQLTIKNIIESPIAGLTLFHQQSLA